MNFNQDRISQAVGVLFPHSLFLSLHCYSTICFCAHTLFYQATPWLYHLTCYISEDTGSENQHVVLFPTFIFVLLLQKKKKKILVSLSSGFCEGKNQTVMAETPWPCYLKSVCKKICIQCFLLPHLLNPDDKTSDPRC